MYNSRKKKKCKRKTIWLHHVLYFWKDVNKSKSRKLMSRKKLLVWEEWEGRRGRERSWEFKKLKRKGEGRVHLPRQLYQVQQDSGSREY